MMVAYLKSAFYVVVVCSLFFGGAAFSQGLRGLAVGDSGVVTGDAARAGSYVFWGGEDVKITVYGEDELSGTYNVNGMGRLAFPLIGGVSLRGLTVEQARALLETRLADGYLKKPSVFIEPITHREFYILGEVRSPGSYDYQEGMTALRAVEIAGGFSNRANTKFVQVLRPRKDASDLYEKKAIEAQIEPGDIILAKEKYF